MHVAFLVERSSLQQGSLIEKPAEQRGSVVFELFPLERVFPKLGFSGLP